MIVKGSSGYQRAAWLATPYRPYEVGPGPHLFADLRFIDPGICGYVDSQGQAVPFSAKQWADPLSLRTHNSPTGVRIEAVVPAKSEPLAGPVGWTVLHDGGLYRSWNGANYSESKDGFVWTRPKLPGEDPAADRNAMFFARTGVHGPGVFIDPSAPAGEKYKMVFWSDRGFPFDHEIFREYFAARPDDYDPYLEARGKIDAIFGAVSPDGLQWKALDAPLVATIGDNPNVCYYDARLGKYVLSTRVSGAFGRRCIGRAESDVFTRFPMPDLNVWADLYRPLSDDLYANTHCLYPGTDDQHFLFPTVFSRSKDTSRIDLYASHDGLHWSRVPGGPVVQGHPDTGDDGFLIALGGQLVPLSGDRVGLHYMGSPYTHEHPRYPLDLGTARYAVWPRGRLACIVADEEGFFATPALQLAGRQLKLNFRTPLSGQVRVEAVAITSWVRKKKQEQVIPARTFDDCDALCGDALSRTVTWRGQSDIGHAAGQAVYFRFRLRNARVYAFEVA